MGGRLVWQGRLGVGGLGGRAGWGCAFTRPYSRGERGFLAAVEAAVEPFDAALGVYDALFAGVEGVALAAYFDAEGGFGGAGLEGVAAGAGHGGVVEAGVDVGFHGGGGFLI